MKRFFAVLLSMILILGLMTGCGNKTQNEVQAAFEKLMTAIRELDMDEAGRYLDTGSLLQVSVDDLDGADAVIDSVFSKLEWEVISCAVSDGDKAVLATKMTTVDLTAVLERCMKIVENGDGSEKSIFEVFGTEIAKSDLPMVTNEINIAMKRFEDGWKVEMNDEFRNAVSAGFLGQIEKAKQSMQNF